MITMDWTLRKVKEGSVHTANYNETAVANGASKFLRVKANDLAAHLVIAADVSANFLMKSYENTTYTAAGTAPDSTKLFVFNRLLGADHLDATVTYGATPNVLGAKRGSKLFVGGTGTHATGGSGSGGIETIVCGGCDLLLEFVCQAGEGKTGNLNVILDWYQDDFKQKEAMPDLEFTDLVVTDTSVVVIPVVPAFDPAVHFYTIETAESAIIIDATSPATFVKGQGTKQLEMGVNTFQVDGYKEGYEPCRYEITITRV